MLYDASHRKDEGMKEKLVERLELFKTRSSKWLHSLIKHTAHSSKPPFSKRKAGAARNALALVPRESSVVPFSSEIDRRSFSIPRRDLEQAEREYVQILATPVRLADSYGDPNASTLAPSSSSEKQKQQQIPRVHLLSGHEGSFRALLSTNGYELEDYNETSDAETSEDLSEELPGVRLHQSKR